MKARAPFHVRLAARTEERYMRPVDLARDSGCTKAAISRYLHGQAFPASRAVQERLAQALDVTLEFFL